MSIQFEMKQAKKQPESLAKNRLQCIMDEPLKTGFAPLTSQSSGFQQDFSRIQAQTSRPELPRSHFASACPLSPRTCPTGGTCHTCPAKIQTKLSMNRPGDRYEQEAERAAERIVQMPNGAQPSSGFAGTTVSDTVGEMQPNVAPLVQTVLSSNGQPMDVGARVLLEQRFGRDFSQVRIHSGARAAQSASALGARAYTVGHNIVFGAGQYRPHAIAGRRLLAHELTHVIQQRNGDSQRIQRQSGGTSGSTSSPASARPDREERFNIGRGGNRFDAELNRPQCMLTLKMKVAFNFLGAGGANTPESWPSPAAQTAWRDSFIRTVMNRWSFRYYLEPDSPCTAERCQRVYARVQVLPVTSNPHFTMNVAYTTDFEGSSVNRTATSAAVGRQATMDALDVQQRTDIPQIPAEHEFGHMLGLPHVHCDTNAAECYGLTSEEKANIMGEGRIVSARDYRVFAEAMYYFNGCNWHATHGRS